MELPFCAMHQMEPFHLVFIVSLIAPMTVLLLNGGGCTLRWRESTTKLDLTVAMTTAKPLQVL